MENEVLLLWVPDHQEIEYNVKAKDLARKGANTPQTGSEPFCFPRGKQLKTWALEEISQVLRPSKIKEFSWFK